MGACGKRQLVWTFVSRVWRQSGPGRDAGGQVGSQNRRRASDVGGGELHESKLDVFNKDQSQEDEVVLGS